MKLHGSKNDYDELIEFVSRTDGNLPGFKDSVEKRMDIDNYFNYIIFETHITNVDSRGNVKYWNSKDYDNKFRWIFYDADLSFSNPVVNYLAKRLSPSQTDWYNPTWTTILLRKLTSNQELKEKFINQYCYLLSTYLSNDSIQNRISYFKEWLMPEINRHLNRRTFRQSIGTWESHIQRLRNFSKNRSTTSFEHLQGCFNLSSSYTLQIHSNIPANKTIIKIAGNQSPGFPFRGKFFKEIPLLISAKETHPLYKFTGWSDNVTEKERIIKMPVDSIVDLTANYSPVKTSSDFKAFQIQGVIKDKENKKNSILIRCNHSTKRKLIKLKEVVSGSVIELQLTGDSKNLVLTNDTAYWKMKHAGSDDILIEHKALKISKKGFEYYLTDENDDIIDSTKNINPIEDNGDGVMYLVRTDGNLIESVVEPDFNLSSDKSNTLNGLFSRYKWIILSLIVGFAGITGFILFKKFRSKK
jgi:hypothetical protein